MTTDPDGRAATAHVELGPLGMDSGGHLLVDRALGGLCPGGKLLVIGDDPHLAVHLGAWARARGHQADGCVLTRGVAEIDRWRGAVRAGGPLPTQVVDRAPSSWGLAARGALVEEGGPDLGSADLDTRMAVWADVAPKLYAQAAAGQWNPDIAINWSEPFDLDSDIEDAVVQVMTYLIENEQAALLVPARFLGRVHPHYREVLQFLATHVADEARHVEVFSRRATLRRSELGTSSAGGRTSLQTLLDESDFSIASFLLSVLGEGTFLHLLSFIERYAPDPVTKKICHLVLQDEARHVAFGLAHLEEQLRGESHLRGRLAASMERRHDALASTSGLNQNVFDALVLLAAGSWDPPAIASGWDAVQVLQDEMDAGRRRRLMRLGFTPSRAMELSELHTRNFM
jgi:hypothetical protein